MKTELLIKKIETLKGFRGWMPSQRENFNWTSPCRCWLPMIPRYLGYDFGADQLALGGCVLKGSLTNTNNQQKELHAVAIRLCESAGISYDELCCFEYLIRGWENETYKSGGLSGTAIFDNGLAYVDEWIQHLESELESTRTDVSYDELCKTHTVAEVIDMVSVGKDVVVDEYVQSLKF